MSIDNIQLPVSLYPSLFKNNLVDLQTKMNRHQSHKQDPEIDFLGGNEKHIAFIINNEHHTYLNDNELKFLSGLINACNITMADISIVNFARNKHIRYNILSSSLASRKILCFGVSSSDIDLPFAIPYFQVQTFQEIQYIFCPHLEQLQEDIDSKKQLWVSLRKIFNLNK